MTGFSCLGEKQPKTTVFSENNSLKFRHFFSGTGFAFVCCNDPRNGFPKQIGSRRNSVSDNKHDAACLTIERSSEHRVQRVRSTRGSNWRGAKILFWSGPSLILDAPGFAWSVPNTFRELDSDFGCFKDSRSYGAMRLYRLFHTKCTDLVVSTYGGSGQL